MELRKLTTTVDEIFSEGDHDVDPVKRVVVVAAVIKNPWAGQGFVDDLAPGIDANASELGALLAPRVMEALGVPSRRTARPQSSVPTARSNTAPP